jgi:hypothetical protein
MFGYVYDSATGQPVTDGYVFLHKPGVDIRKRLESDLLATFKIDKTGRWGFPSFRWKRGENYPIAIYSEKYAIAWANDFRIDADSPDPLRVDVQLDPK